MRIYRLPLTVVFLISVVSLASSQADVANLSDVAQHAMEQSKLTLSGNAAFHLKASIVETTNPKSDYRAEIEEHWLSPDKWRRTINSPGFSQTLIVNSDVVSEVNQGDYFPWWLNDLVTALLDPLPLMDKLKSLKSQMRKPSGGEHSNSCARLQMKVGAPPAENDAFLVFCFEGSKGLLESVTTPGYEADFKDYKAFRGKQVARRISIDPEPGTTIEAKVVELNELSNVDENMFAIQQSTPIAQRIGRVVVSDAVVRNLAPSADILWPAVRSGKTTGVLTMFISVDRAGHVRETWPLNSDNAGLEDPARAQVKKWQFKPAISNGAPVQVEGLLTLAFNTKIGDPIPILSDEEVRKLASHMVEPVFPSNSPKGTEVKVQIGVDLDGTVNGVGNPYGVSTELFIAAAEAVRQWRFRSYIRNGKPDIFGADVVFHVR